MTGPEHYKAAEQLLIDADGIEAQTGRDFVMVAQVHATLALAAATALGLGSDGLTNDPIVSAWWEVAS